MKRVLLLIPVGIALAVLAAFAYFRIMAVPIRETVPAWSSTVLPKDAHQLVPQHVIQRARLDQFVKPIPGTARLIGLMEVWQLGPDEIYLGFGESMPAHRFILYRYSRAQRKLLWKAADSNPP
jgi:hypothetical protein